MTLHPESELILERIKSEKVPALYHFTDIDNLPLIIDLGGLHSKEFLEQNGYLDQIKCGGNLLSKGLDIHHGNWDKISLSWCSRHPMAYSREQKQHLCYVIVDTRVALRNGVIFTNKNATDSYHTRSEGIDGLNNVNFDAVRATFPYTKETKKLKQAEILVPEYVEIQEIKFVAFRSQSSLEEAKRLCHKNPEFIEKFTIAERVFHLQAPYAYVQSHFLTSAVVTNENVTENILQPQTVFSIEEHAKITLVVAQKLIYETKYSVRFLNKDKEIISSVTEKFFYSGEYWNWFEVDSDLFTEGIYTAEFYLSGNEGDIRQFIIPFSVTN